MAWVGAVIGLGLALYNESEKRKQAKNEEQYIKELEKANDLRNEEIEKQTLDKLKQLGKQRSDIDQQLSDTSISNQIQYLEAKADIEAFAAKNGTNMDYAIHDLDRTFGQNLFAIGENRSRAYDELVYRAKDIRYQGELQKGYQTFARPVGYNEGAGLARAGLAGLQGYRQGMDFQRSYSEFRTANQGEV